MLAALVRFSIRFRGVILMLAVVAMAYGGYRLMNAGLDIFPEFAPKLVTIQTEAPGLTAEQVEVLVTQPIEQALAGIVDLEYVRSESIQGLSVITMVFAEHTDVYRNRQLVTERLAGVGKQLPPGVEVPVPVPLASSSATVQTIGLTSDEYSLMELRDLVDWTLVPNIMSAEGVADVNVFGGEIRQLQIQLLPDQLDRHGVSVQQVIDAARQATGIYGAGFVENENQRITLRMEGQPDSAAELAKVVLKRQQGRPIQLGDVAEIEMAAAPPIGAGSIMGKDGIVMMIIGQYGANTLTVSRNVEQVLAGFEPILSDRDITLYPELFRPANYIEDSLANISGHLFIGGLFVIVVLLLFLFNLRTALISALAIPLSLISAAVVMLELGMNLNIMVLGGLAIALGEVVDDAIIDTENIFRRLRENRLLDRPRRALEVVYEASMEVRGSVVYASFIVALVFVPLLTLGGVAGRLFAPLGIAYILAILMSLLVALTVTPALCYLLLVRSHLSDKDPPLIAAIKPVYAATLRGLARVPGLAIGASLVVCLIGAAILPRLGGEFLPELREGHYMVHTTLLPGTSLNESIRVGNQLTEQFLEIPGVRSVSQWAGRAERGADTYGSHYSEFEVDLERGLSGSEQQAVLDRLREILREFPGLLYEANTFLIERVDETISGYSSPVVVNIYGNDLDYLDRKAAEVAEHIRAIDGATDVQVRSSPGTPLLRMKLDMDNLAFWGLQPVEVLNTVQTAYEGKTVSRISEDNRLYEVAVMLDETRRRDIHDVGTLPLRNSDGELIPLDRVASLTQTDGRYNILHQDGQRLQTVTANAEGRDTAGFLDEIQRKLHAEVDFAADTYPEYTGAAVEQAEARADLLLHAALVSVIVLLLIYIAIGSLRHMLLTLVNVPFSLVGGVIAALVTGGTLSVGSLVGFITLFGITVRNSIMLLSHYQHLIQQEQQPWNVDTLVRGAQERLPSILMTALVTALAMLPIAFDSDNAGREIMGPMAAIIIGGLASSTLLNLLVLPVILYRFGNFTSDSDRDEQPAAETAVHGR
ncbi:CzcA family heavy metal efflux pump [Methylohalomonas lacus]|uniref:CzcA family heavy metal efflux pump n=1 Tax=Methylohalomonas lacus TaxID=398773 RepID=A0AAE3HLD6_9GAMM|nr:efflux RND transporter permease subunit [Methylohalomonas lacus]MCS3902552.1 CzcA family heavy metal efflux pump [Methylohalomonas lacus]